MGITTTTDEDTPTTPYPHVHPHGAHTIRGAKGRPAEAHRRNAYITAEAGLTADEAAAFIPLENELQRRKMEVGRECRKLARKNRSHQGLTDRERRELSDCLTETRLKEAQLEKEYIERFKKILSVEKLSKYQQAEAEFLRKFLQNRKRDD